MMMKHIVKHILKGGQQKKQGGTKLKKDENATNRKRPKTCWNLSRFPNSRSIMNQELLNVFCILVTTIMSNLNV